MIESGNMGYTGEGAAGAAGGTAGAAGGAGESPSPLEGTDPGPDASAWACDGSQPVPTPMGIDEVTAPPDDRDAGAVAGTGAEDAAMAMASGPMRQGEHQDEDEDVDADASGLGSSRGIDVAGTNATDEGASGA
jgi:hypothetical protein